MVLLCKVGEGYLVERAEEGVHVVSTLLWIPVVSLGEKRKCSAREGGIVEREIGLGF